MFASLAIFALVLSLVYGAIPFAVAQGNPNQGSGAVWTNTGPCGAPQNVNQYTVGQVFYGHGSNFEPNTQYTWIVKNTGSQGATLISGQITTDGDGDFCGDLFTTTISQVGGPYQFNVGGAKNDNFKIVAAAPTTGTITVTKTVENNSGRNAQVSDFALFVGVTQVTSGQSVQVAPGTYAISETGVQTANYTATFGGACSTTSITVVAGQSYSCSITNNDNPIIIRGCTDDSANNYNPNATEDDDSCTYNPNVVPGCMDQDAVNYNNLATTDNGSCEYVFTVNKVVANSNASVTGFSYTVSGPEPVLQTSFDTDASVPQTLLGGTYSVSEVPVAGFTPSYSGCQNVVLDGPKTCTITNTFDPVVIPGCMYPDANNYVPTANTSTTCTYDLTVTKVIVGTTTVSASAFSFVVDDTIATAFEPNGSNVVSVSAGIHSVTEVNAPAYTTTYSVGCVDVTIDGPVTCTITNTLIVNPVFGSITIDKVVAGTDANENQVFSFGLLLDSLIQLSANSNPYPIDELAAGSYVITENNLSGGWELASVVCRDRETLIDTPLTPDENDSVSITLGADQDLTCTFTNTRILGCMNPLASNYDDTATVDDGSCTFAEDTYLLEGYVWHDENENDVWEGHEESQEEATPESSLTGWEVKATNGSVTLITTTDETGYYSFTVIAGTWTITETLMNEWELTFPNTGSHVVTVPEVVTQSGSESIFASLMSRLIPTAHASLIGTYGQFNFGNVFKGCTSNCGGGGGGGTRISLSDSDNDNDNDSDTEIDPIGEVLGESISVLPIGAPNTGAGGASSSPIATLISFFGMLMSLVTLRVTKNNA